MLRAGHFISVKRRSVLTRENELRAARRSARSTCTALVHIDGWGRWLRVTEPHSPGRLAELRRYAMAFDDGHYIAVMRARLRNPNGACWLPDAAATYADMRDFLGNYTDDEILAARAALEFVGPARSSLWRER